MGAIETKKNDILRRYELPIDLKKPLRNWSFAEIKTLYANYCNRTNCPFIDSFLFKKIMISTGLSAPCVTMIYESFTDSDRYISIFELLCALVLLSYNSYKRKLQLIFCIFDFRHEDKLRNRVLILIFESLIYGFCRLTGQPRPAYPLLSKYSFERFIRTNTLEVLDRLVSLRRLLEEVEGNADATALFEAYEIKNYNEIIQDSYLFEISQYKKYTNSEITRFYRIVQKAYLEANFQEVDIQDRNKRFRLENRKIACIKLINEERELRMTKRSYTQSKLAPLLTVKDRTTFRTKSKNNMLFLNGDSLSKKDIFETITYFKTLSNNEKDIKFKDFFQKFERKAFMKKQLSSLFKYFDKKSKGSVNFVDFLATLYPKIRGSDITQIEEWNHKYQQIYDIEVLNPEETRKGKREGIQLPKETLQRVTEIFNSIDRGRKGYLSFEDMKIAYQNGYTITEIQLIVKEQGGKISLQNFTRMILPQGWTIEGTNIVGAK